MTSKLWLILLLVFVPLSFAGAVPFSEDEIVIPVRADTEEPTVEITSDNPEAELAPDQQTATFTKSLWKDLRKLYGTLGCRIGQRKSGKDKEAAEHHLNGFDDLEIDIDGDNYCGQFAMSTLLKGMGIDVDPQQVYKDSNPAGIFTSPPVIAEHLRKNGINARMKNKASIKDITKRIDEGRPVIVLVDSGDGVPHWICITGYDTDASGKVTSFRMRDSYWGTDGPHTMPVDEFEKAWKSPFGNSVLGGLVSYENVLIDNLGPCKPTSTAYPGTFNTATEDNMASGINDVVTGWKNHSPGQVIGGATKLIVGLPGAIVGVASNFTRESGEKMVSWGQDRWNQGGFWNKVSGGASIVGGHIAEGVGTAGKVVADAWSSGASLIGQGFKKLGSLFS
ncbi:MAG: C39 family peptidase [Candidatus Rifleibacteriota bacterium]